MGRRADKPDDEISDEYIRGIRDAAKVCSFFRATFESAVEETEGEERETQQALLTLANSIEDRILSLIGETSAATFLAQIEAPKRLS